jgi:hypothetical protein
MSKGQKFRELVEKIHQIIFGCGDDVSQNILVDQAIVEFKVFED